MATDRIVVNSSGKDIILADWSDTVLEGVPAEFSNDFQVAKFFRGTKVQVFDRGNQSVTLAFTVIKEWKSINAAFDWFLTARRTVPKTGNVTWQSRDRSSVFTKQIRGAGIQVRSLPRIGLATRTVYEIIGGEVS